MFIDILLTQARLFTGCTGETSLTLIHKKVSYISSVDI